MQPKKKKKKNGEKVKLSGEFFSNEFFFSEEKILAWYCVNFSSNNRKSPKLRTKVKYSGIVAKP